MIRSNAKNMRQVAGPSADGQHRERARGRQAVETDEPGRAGCRTRQPTDARGRGSPSAARHATKAGGSTSRPRRRIATAAPSIRTATPSDDGANTERMAPEPAAGRRGRRQSGMAGRPGARPEPSRRPPAIGGSSPRSCRPVTSRMSVNGIADLAEDLDRDEEAGEQEDDAEELAELEQLGRPEAVEAVGRWSG